MDRAARFVVAAQNQDGGWGFRTGVESDNDTSSCALLALEGISDIEQERIEKGIAYLAARQRKDGLWNTWQSQDDHPVEDCVAHVVSALSAYAGTHRVSVDAAYRWLVQQHEIRGRWTAGWYRSFPYAVCEIGSAIGAYHPICRAARKALIAAQNEDGGWGEEPGEESFASATGLAIAALLAAGDLGEQAIRRGLEYIIETQGDGTWRGRPEVNGPRPLLYHLATNTHAFVVQGLMAAWRKHTERSPTG
jgi:squalene-hopene/tetraprenyl-beta-curcumene cyclase